MTTQKLGLDKVDLVWYPAEKCCGLADPATGEVLMISKDKTASQLSHYALWGLGVREVRWAIDISAIPENKR